MKLGGKRRKTVVIDGAISRVVPADDEQGRAALRRFFKGATAKTPEWWRRLRAAVTEIEQELGAREDVVYIAGAEGQPGAGVVSLATGATAMQRILQRSHVLASEEQVRRYKKAAR